MQYNNIKLKWTVVLLANTFAHSTAFALGLGDIEVKSHLGQPLKAQIKVLSAVDVKGDVGCFNLSSENTSYLGGTHLKLRQINADEAVLTVTSTQAVNEPIVNLSLITTCDSEVRRDYVVLLDPPLSSEQEFAADAEETQTAIGNDSLDVPLVRAKAHPQTIGKTASITTNNHNKNKSLVKRSRHGKNQNIIIANNTGGMTTTVESKTVRPTLSISGGSHQALSAANINLRMDRQLVMRPNAADPAPAADPEMMDELTAMNNRLKHLQTQISQLQENNLKLAQDNAEKSKALSSNQSELTQFKQFGFGLGAILLLLSGYLVLDWWRRRKAHLTVLDRIMQEKQDDVINDEDLFEIDEPRQKISSTAESSTPEIEDFGIAEEPEDPFVVEDDPNMTVLDHADLFLSHGRTELAIQLLQNHLLEHPKQSVTIWLFLLDLLAKSNLQALYEQTAMDCKDHFNINIPNIDTKPAATAHTLEAYPHLSAGLQAVWGTPAAITFLDDLIYNNRLEPRVGFDKQLIEELLALRSVAQERANLAEVIMLDEKKMVLKERKEALLSAKKAEKLQQLDEIAKASEEARQADLTKEQETNFEFGLIEWK